MCFLSDTLKTSRATKMKHGTDCCLNIKSMHVMAHRRRVVYSLYSHTYRWALCSDFFYQDFKSLSCMLAWMTLNMQFVCWKKHFLLIVINQFTGQIIINLLSNSISKSSNASLKSLYYFMTNKHFSFQSSNIDFRHCLIWQNVQNFIFKLPLLSHQNVLNYG